MALGLVLGVPAALAVGRLLASQLVGLSVLDPLTMGGVALVLILTGLIAAPIFYAYFKDELREKGLV